MSLHTDSAVQRGVIARRIARGFALPLIALTIVMAVPVAAQAAYVWSEGGTKDFKGTEGTGLFVNNTGKSVIRLSRVKVWTFSGNSASFSPRTAQRLKNGNTVIADPGDQRVVEVNSGGSRVWAYEGGSSLVLPYSAQRLANGNTLIADYGAGAVFEVDSGGNTKWTYDSTDAGPLLQPYLAVRLSTGNTLVVDSGNHRVIVVDKNGTKKWQHGTTGVPGSGNDALNTPTFAQRLDNGRTLIADSGNHRVIEVDGDGVIRWQFGKTGSAGSDLTRLRFPTSAQRQTDGTTLIVDRDNNRLLRVDPAGKAEKIPTDGIKGVGSLSSPQTAVVTQGDTNPGTILVADQGKRRLVEFGYAKSGRYTTDPLDLGTAGVSKQLTRIDAVATTPDKTSVKIQYSINGGPWRAVNASYVVFPAGLLATSARVRVDLATSNRYVTPQVTAVQVTYNVVTTAAGTTGTNTSALFGAPLALGPYSTGTGGAAAKSAGAAGALPQGSATPGVAQATVYSGYLMKRVTGSEAATKDTKGLSGLPIEAAGTAAALLLLTSVYSVGLASTTLSKATGGALGALRSILTRSV